MAENATNHLVNYAKLDSSMIEKLSEIRNWENISIAFEGKDIWLKGMRDDQTKSKELKCIPHIQLFYSQKGKLFPIGSMLPAGNEPSLLWTPIYRGIKVEIPNHNHNHFGINGNIPVKIIRSDEEKEAIGMITSLKTLEAFVLNSANIRLKNIQWVIINQDQAFLLGKPILPITGETYWRSGDFFLPTGYCLDLAFLSKDIDLKLNSNQLNLIIWDTDSKYFAIDKLQMAPLTISSFRKTLLLK